MDRFFDGMFSRLIRLVNVLRSHPDGVSISFLAAACHADTATVAADLEMLSEFGRAPLTCSSDDEDEVLGSDAVWGLASNQFSFPITSLTRHEAVTLIRLLEGESHEKARSARAKIGAALRKCRSLSHISHATRRRVIKGGKPVYGEGQDEAKIDRLDRAVAEGSVLVIRYVNARGRESVRHTLPVALVYGWTTCAWYVYGYNPEDGGFRHFRVTRILGYWPSDKKISAPSHEAIMEQISLPWGVEWSGEPCQVIVRFRDDFNVLTRMQADTKGRTQARRERQADGSVIYTDTMPGWNEFRTWVATFGESAEVLHPPELRQSMAEAARRVLERYGVSP